eukprot:1545587-Alexandrium_andersonii.AAC.1
MLPCGVLQSPTEPLRQGTQLPARHRRAISLRGRVARRRLAGAPAAVRAMARAGRSRRRRALRAASK